MSPEKQKIAIAKACKLLYSHTEEHPFKTFLWFKTVSGRLTECPDYLNDLNAMHEAEQSIPKQKRDIYTSRIMDIIGPDGEVDLIDDYGDRSTSSSTSFFSILHTSAAQRAEAFLKTLNLWEES